MKKLTSGLYYGVLAIIWYIIFLSSIFPSKNVERWIYKTVILPLFCRGMRLGFSQCGVGDMLRFVENRVLRKTFGPKRDEVTGKWRRLHNEELNALYSSPDTFG